MEQAKEKTLPIPHLLELGLLPQEAVDERDFIQPLFSTIPKENIAFYENLLLEGMLELISTYSPALGAEIDSAINHPAERIRKFIRHKLAAAGRGGLKGIASVFAVMLKDVPLQVVDQIQPIVKLVGAQHILEVPPDSLDKGVDNDEVTLEILNFLSSTAWGLSQDAQAEPPTLTGEFEDNYRLAEMNDSLTLAIREKLDNFLVKIISATVHLKTTEIRKITYTDLLNLHLMSIHRLQHYVFSDYGSVTDEVDTYLIDALADRYGGAGLTVQMPDSEGGKRGYEQLVPDAAHLQGYAINGGEVPSDLLLAVHIREKSVMIGVTMSALLREIAQVHPDVRYTLSVYEADVIEAIRLTCVIVGIYNDIGATIIRLSVEDMGNLFNYLHTLAPHGNLRDAIAPKQFKHLVAKTKDVSTSNLARLRAEMAHGYEDVWTALAQLLKDAEAGEHNLGFDLGGTDHDNKWFYRYLVFRSLQRLVVDYRQQLKTYLGQFDPITASIIGNAEIFHAQMYQGNEYYGNNYKALLAMPILNGELQEEDIHLLADCSVRVH